MKNVIIKTGLIITILSACSDEQSITNETNMQSISNFNLDTLTPIHNEKIRVLYCSSIENPNLEKEYLIQFVAIRIEKGDTINVISDHSENIKKEDADQVFLLNRRTISDFHIQQKVDNAVYETLKGNGVEINTMVISDPKFQSIEYNNLKTIIGDISKQ